MELSDYFNLIAPPFVVSFIAVGIIHPYIVRIAKIKGIVDAPNARKLQKGPVPVLGGTAVFFGIFMSMSIANALATCTGIDVLMSVMVLMLYLGTIDDILDLRAVTRLIVQIIAALVLIYLGGGYYLIDSMLGLWGFNTLPYSIAVLLTLLSIVGLINAVNLIDGVDGLSSGFGIMACFAFMIAFLYVADYTMVILCASMIGALLLFFFHNVFGQKTKMFIGDGGTLVLGIVIAACVIRLLHIMNLQDTRKLINEPASAISFTLAILSVPVFDTLRVMSRRILMKKSPFHPDKTHLHHMFIELGFSHVLTTACILTINSLVILVWICMFFGGVSANTQTVIILMINFLVTFGLYYSVQLLCQRKPETYAHLVEYIRSIQPLREKWFLSIQKIADKI